MTEWNKAEDILPKQNLRVWVLFEGQTDSIFDSIFTNKCGWHLPDNFKNYADPLGQRRISVKYWAYADYPVEEKIND